eukprot:6186541-Pleurochrysis_carterae.AAC.2
MRTRIRRAHSALARTRASTPTVCVCVRAQVRELNALLSSTVMLRRLKRDVLSGLLPKTREVVLIDPYVHSSASSHANANANANASTNAAGGAVSPAAASRAEFNSIDSIRASLAEAEARGGKAEARSLMVRARHLHMPW